MNIISSNQNPIIKEVKSLKSKKYRDEKGLYFIEGIRFVEEALNEASGIERIFVSERLEEVKGGKEILFKISKGSYETYMLPDKLFKEISDTENPQGVLAVIKIPDFKLDDLLTDNSFIIILESLQDPGNMGTIIRTADAAGATGIIVSKGCVDLYNPKVLRSTMGSIFHVPIFFSQDLTQTINIIKSKDIKVYAAHLKGRLNYFETGFNNNTAIIIGNEANGISDEIAECAHELVKIPMPGRAESLNASIAAGLLIYEVVRQKTDKK